MWYTSRLLRARMEELRQNWTAAVIAVTHGDERCQSCAGTARREPPSQRHRSFYYPQYVGLILINIDTCAETQWHRTSLHLYKYWISKEHWHTCVGMQPRRAHASSSHRAAVKNGRREWTMPPFCSKYNAHTNPIYIWLVDVREWTAADSSQCDSTDRMCCFTETPDEIKWNFMVLQVSRLPTQRAYLLTYAASYTSARLFLLLCLKVLLVSAVMYQKLQVLKTACVVNNKLPSLAATCQTTAIHPHKYMRGNSILLLVGIEEDIRHQMKDGNHNDVGVLHANLWIYSNLQDVVPACRWWVWGCCLSCRLLRHRSDEAASSDFRGPARSVGSTAIFNPARLHTYMILLDPDTSAELNNTAGQHTLSRRLVIMEKWILNSTIIEH